MRATINEAILIGDGIGKPQGLLHPNSAIPLRDVDRNPGGANQLARLVMLNYELPVQWQANGRYLMNQRTFALLLTMSDATGRPLSPVAFGDFAKAYMIAERKQPTYKSIRSAPAGVASTSSKPVLVAR